MSKKRQYRNKKATRNLKHKQRNYTQAGPVTVTNAKGETWELPPYDVVQLARVTAGARLRNRVTSDQRAKVYKRDGGRCRYCRRPVGSDYSPYEIDHVIPLAKGGATELSNLVLACRPCNRTKGDQIWKPNP